MKPVAPGSVIGVLGSGQLGRMFAIAARQMGYRVHTYSADTDTPAGQVSDKEWNASYDDLDSVRKFARGVSVVTFEFENIPTRSLEAAAELAPIRPGVNVLHVTQHRLREKTFLSKAGFPVTVFHAVRSLADLSDGLKKTGVPAVLKTAGFGYDGKGQKKVTTHAEAEAAFEALGNEEAILEGFVRFDKELSVVAARGEDGTFAHFGVMENQHANHILDVTVTPALVPGAVSKAAIKLARAILEELDVVGVMCVEMFLTTKGKLLVNELAPRPHNSGHLTIDAFVTSQFEQQLRAVCGLPLGSTEMKRPAAMANLLGDLWKEGEPRWEKALKMPSVKLHLYGKQTPRPGRKMGHLTALAATAQDARRLALKARSAL
jgi:5-(carboxyamino)imidazole ribonucleotide synthase